MDEARTNARAEVPPEASQPPTSVATPGSLIPSEELEQILRWLPLDRRQRPVSADPVMPRPVRRLRNELADIGSA